MDAEADPVALRILVVRPGNDERGVIPVLNVVKSAFGNVGAGGIRPTAR